MTRLSFSRRLAADNGGASAIEFSLVAAFLILPLTLGIYDFGTALYYWMQVGNAARAGAQFINVNGYSKNYDTSTLSCSGSNFTCAIQTASSLGTNVTVKAASPVCGCQDGTSSPPTLNIKTYAPPCNTCNATYTSNCCPATQTPVTLSTVNATYSYKPIFSYFGFGPSSGIPLGASATALLY